jgi:hypothetical protein
MLLGCGAIFAKWSKIPEWFGSGKNPGCILFGKKQSRRTHKGNLKDFCENAFIRWYELSWL